MYCQYHISLIPLQCTTGLAQRLDARHRRGHRRLGHGRPGVFGIWYVILPEARVRTRGTTWSIDHIVQRQARMTLGVLFIRANFFFRVYVVWLYGGRTLLTRSYLVVVQICPGLWKPCGTPRPCWRGKNNRPKAWSTRPGCCTGPRCAGKSTTY